MTTVKTMNNGGFENEYGDFSKFKKVKPEPLPYLEWVYLQYILVSGLYMLEPWERKLFNWIIIFFLTTLFSIISYFLL